MIKDLPNFATRLCFITNTVSRFVMEPFAKSIKPENEVRTYFCDYLKVFIHLAGIYQQYLQNDIIITWSVLRQFPQPLSKPDLHRVRSFIFQSFLFLKVIHFLLRSFSSSCCPFHLSFNNVFQKAVRTQDVSSSVSLPSFCGMQDVQNYVLNWKHFECVFS